MAEDTEQTSDTKTTTDHETIREWIEQRGSIPAQVTEPAGDDPGSLAVIPEGKMDDSVREVSWEKFFEIFEDEGLAFVYQTKRDNPDEQWFCKFDERGDAGTDMPNTIEIEDRDTLAEPEENKSSADPDENAQAIGTEDIDEDEIIAGEMTSRGEGAEEGIDEQTFGESRDKEISAEREPLESEPSEPVEANTDTEPIESDSTEGEPIETGSEPTGTDTADPAETESGIDETTAGTAGGSTEAAGVVGLTVEDEGKDVVDESGDHLGTVNDIEEDAIHVDPDPEITDDRRSEFGWDDRESETHWVENDRIREITVTEVVIFRL